jgi:hypothetical protein
MSRRTKPLDESPGELVQRLDERSRMHCPECGLRALESHRCGVPILLDAIGRNVTPLELRYVRWLSQWDHETIDVFAGLFRRIREG